MVRSLSSISITGLGVICPLGNTLEECFQKLLCFESGNSVKGSSLFNHRSKCDTVMICSSLASDSKYDRVTGFAYRASSQAIEESGVLGRYPAHRIGCFLGYGMPGVVATLKLQSGGNKTSRSLSSLLANTPSAVLCDIYRNGQFCLLKEVGGRCSIEPLYYNIRGLSHTVSTACSSGLDAIRLAYDSLMSNQCDAALCIGTESCVVPLVLESFDRMRALSRYGLARPFSADRDGFVLSEGAGAIVLERKSASKAIGEVMGCGVSSNGHSASLTSLNQDAASTAIRLAISSLKPNMQVHYCNAHAAGTIKGDHFEIKAIDSVFQGQSLYVSSMKGAIGHTLGASGPIELALSIRMLKQRMIIGTTNLKNGSPCSSETNILGHNEVVQVPGSNDLIAIKNAFGFGGGNCCIMFSA